MALTRAQLLSGNSNQGRVLPGQVQAVSAGSGVVIASNGQISVDSTITTGFVKLNNTSGYNNYIWPTLAAAPIDKSILVTSGGGDLLWTTNYVQTTSETGAAMLPVGTTSLRPTPAESGQIRFNSDTALLEYYDGVEWIAARYQFDWQPVAGNPNAIGVDVRSDGLSLADGDQAWDTVLNLLYTYNDADTFWKPVGVINEDLALYVSTTGSDATGEGTFSNPWATPQNAMDFLSNFTIEEFATVTITLLDGTYNLSQAVELNHPNGSQITITGGSTTGPRPTGNDLNGGGVTGNTAATQSFNDAVLKGHYNTVLQFNGTAGFTCTTGGNVTLSNMLIRGDGVTSANGIACGNANGASSGGITLANDIAVHNFNGRGIQCWLGGSVFANNVTITNCESHGLYVSHGGAIRAQDGTISNSGGNGVHVNHGGEIYIPTAVSSYNSGEGVYISFGGEIEVGGLVANNNGQNGVYVLFGGSVSCSAATASNNADSGIFISYGGSIYANNSTVSNNTNYGLFVNAGGSLYADSSVVSGSGITDVFCNLDGVITFYSGTAGSFSPAPNTTGNGKGYIAT